MSSDGKGSHILVDRPSRPRASERQTRAPAVLWDRIKLLVLLGILWLAGLAVVWSTTVKPLDGPLVDAFRIATNDYWWLLALMALEFAASDPLLHRGTLQGLLPLLADVRVRRRGPASRRDERVHALPRRPSVQGAAVPAGGQHPARPHLQHRPGLARHRRSACATRRGPAVRAAARVRLLLRDVPVHRPVLVPVARRHRHDHARRDRDPVRRREGPGRRARSAEGDPGLPRRPRGDRVAGRLRARRHPAVGPAGHRQDPHGPGGGRRDGQAVRERRRRARSSTCSWASASSRCARCTASCGSSSMRYGGAIVFIDEADSLGSRGQQVGDQGYTPVLSRGRRRRRCNGLAYLSAAGRDGTFHGRHVAAGPGRAGQGAGDHGRHGHGRRRHGHAPGAARRRCPGLDEAARASSTRSASCSA